MARDQIKRTADSKYAWSISVVDPLNTPDNSKEGSQRNHVFTNACFRFKEPQWGQAKDRCQRQICVITVSHDQRKCWQDHIPVIPHHSFLVLLLRKQDHGNRHQGRNINRIRIDIAKGWGIWWLLGIHHIYLKSKNIHLEIIRNSENAYEDSNRKERVQIPSLQFKKTRHKKIYRHIDRHKENTIITARRSPERFPFPVFAQRPGNHIRKPECDHCPIAKAHPFSPCLKIEFWKPFDHFSACKPIAAHNNERRNRDDTVKLVFCLQNIKIIVPEHQRQHT